MIIDCHTHVMDKSVDVKKLLGRMDDSGVDRIMAMSAMPPVEIWGKKSTLPPARESINTLNKLVQETGERLIPFVWVDPSLDTCLDDISYAIEEKKFKGVKMIPTVWYPYDEDVWKVYEHIKQYKVPILFHSGIIWMYGDASRRCRPVNYEIMMKYPEIKFALAHCSWPWTDECIAVSGKFNEMAERGEIPAGRQMYVDMTPGTPRSYRSEVFKRIFSLPEYHFEEQLMFGTDCALDDYSTKWTKEWLDLDNEILYGLNVSKAVKDAYFAGNFLNYLGE
jgi:predicted TIM-barrel fold metal-dependent hydrolase